VVIENEKNHAFDFNIVFWLYEINQNIFNFNMIVWLYFIYKVGINIIGFW